MNRDREFTYIYHALKSMYSNVCRPIMRGLFNDSIEVERPKVMFPPNESSTITAQEAESGFLQRNCVIISAFRGKNPDGTHRNKDANMASTDELENDLKEKGLHFFKVDGCFREKTESKASHEVSFFVYDDESRFSKKFFITLYELSEKYNQDSFLYKSAGMSRFAFLIATNNDTRKDYDITPAGALYLNLPPVGPYTNLGKNNGRITFKLDKQSEEGQFVSKCKVFERDKDGQVISVIF